jgi:hypothetical protein
LELMRLFSLGWPISRTASALLELGGQGTDTDGSTVRNEAKEIAQSASAQSQSPSLDVIAARFPLPWSHYLQQVGCVAKTHRDAERCVIASSTHPTGYWAEADREREEREFLMGKHPAVRDARKYAAAELFRLTGELRWNALFVATTEFTNRGLLGRLLGSHGLRVHRTQADGRHCLRLGIPGSQAETGNEIHRLRARVMRTQLGDGEIDRVIRHIAGKLMPGLES